MRPLAITLAGLLLFTAACGGGDKAEDGTAQPGATAPATDGGTGSGGQTPNDVPSLNPKSAPDLPQPTETGPVAKDPKPKQVSALVGTWKGNSPAEDYFVFNAKGQGKFVAGGEELWKGTVIPAGDKTFRLSWEGHDPGVAYWQVQLKKDGTLTFAANQQVYEKVTKKK